MNPASKQRRLQDAVELYAARAFAAFLAWLPGRVLGPLAWTLGGLGFWMMPRRRRVSIANLGLVFPDWPESRRRAVARESFRRVARVYLDALSGALLPSRFSLKDVEVEGLEHLESARAAGVGAVLVAAHLGNWELLGAAVARLGYPHLGLGKRLKNAALGDWIQRRRREWGVETVWASRLSSLDLLEKLENKGMISIVADQDARDKGVEVEFLGQRTRGHRAPALLALSAGCPVIAASIARRPSGGHRIRLERVALPPLDAGLSLDAAVERGTSEILRVLGAAILEHPEEYLWAHDRFKSQGAGKSLVNGLEKGSS